MNDDKHPLEHDSSEDRPLTKEELFLEEVLRAQEEALEEERARRRAGVVVRKRQPKTVRVAIYMIAFTMIFSTFAILFQMFSIPAIEFIKVSATLSQQEHIKQYKQSIVTINTNDSKGTGFAISEDGYIVTNAHVIEDALSLTITFPNDGIYNGKIVAQYEEVDLAVIKVEGKNLPALQLADQLTYKPGEHIYFIGNPLYFSGIANEGKLLETIRTASIDTDIMMIDAPVYKGNSGSPIINDAGQVIGVVYATLRHDDYGKVGLFVPIDELHKRFTIDE